MATSDKLKKYVTAIAEAIREKTGKSELIAPINFAEEIRGITAGGGGSGESEFFMKYYDIDAMYSSLGATIDKASFIDNIKSETEAFVFLLAGIYTANNKGTAPLSMFPMESFNNVSKLGFLYGLTLVEGGKIMKVTPEFVSQILEGYSIDQFEITEEEFYDFNE